MFKIRSYFLMSVLKITIATLLWLFIKSHTFCRPACDNLYYCHVFDRKAHSVVAQSCVLSILLNRSTLSNQIEINGYCWLRPFTKRSWKFNQTKTKLQNNWSNVPQNYFILHNCVVSFSFYPNRPMLFRRFIYLIRDISQLSHCRGQCSNDKPICM